jgi:hypothetical protein
VARLSELLVEVQEAAAAFEADRWTGDDCVRLSEELARAAKACTAASARAAARALECGRRDTEWVARTSGATPAQARESLSTTAALTECQATSEAVAAGAVSLAQAREIVRAEAAVPGSEGSLLEVAQTRGMAGLRAEARRIVLGSIPREELHRRQWAARSVRHWIDADGMVAGQFKLPPEVGVPIVNRLDRATDRLQNAARRKGESEGRDAREAHAADALVAMVKGGGRGGAKADAKGDADDANGDANGDAKGGRRRADVVYVCDLRAAMRGHTHGDEVCHVVGGGPVPVAVVREAALEAFVKVAVRDGTKIDTIVHYGRHIPAVLRTALELGDPERLDGLVCVEEGCDRRHDLELDHVDPVANDGPTSYENIEPRCKPDHWAKTERDRKAGKLSRRAPP